MSNKLNFRLPTPYLLLALVVCLISLPQTAAAQSGGTVETGTTIAIRTNEEINVDRSDGRIFSGVVDQDVRDGRGAVALPEGTYVELMVRSISNNEYVLDLESVTVNGRRMGVEA